MSSSSASRAWRYGSGMGSASRSANFLCSTRRQEHADRRDARAGGDQHAAQRDDALFIQELAAEEIVEEVARQQKHALLPGAHDVDDVSGRF